MVFKTNIFTLCFFRTLKIPIYFYYLKLILEAAKFDRAKKYFAEFELFFEEAKKIHRFGREIGGSIFGIRRNMRIFGIKHETVSNF